MSNGRTLSPRPISSPEEAETPARQGGRQSSGNGGGQGNLQDAFLNLLRKNKTPVTMFLVKGVKLQGIVTWFDNFSILLRRDGQSQLVYKHAISTIMPGQSVDAGQFQTRAGNKKQRLLQDVFLNRVSESNVQVTMFLVNGVMLQGRLAAYDLFCMLLERDGAVQLAYKHAVSTIQPASPVDLSDDEDADYGDDFGADD
ncbi:RNA chaperone Hfq [Erythrobacter rubeus]|uniref:RNA-binding protein Hfq n=1 Tax=Erythrobacter rubeus TaxID=2760803 RepID=A0ABR8KPI0_9SPHN|nr:RNA chaperone Hfq [Erythrobacter rubeus]MBD2841769.1 RNA chaperone Hfq [Erythrobacter rubeus]